MARRPRARDLWLPVLGAVVLGAIAAELVQDLGAAAPPAPLPPTTLGDWPGRTLRGVQAVGAGPLPAGLLPAATGMMAALEGWRDATFARDVVVSVVAHDPLGRWGYYDAGAHRLRIVGDGAGVIGAMTVVHELTHALQDQHLDLGGRAAPSPGTDAGLAWRALVEGEAMLAGAELTGVPLDAHGDLPQLRALDDDAAESLFLYMDGAAFVAAVRDARGWSGLTAAWEAPPRTTVEILDPALFLDETPLLDPVALGEGERAGAFALWRLLGATPEGRAEGRAIARAWRGDARDADRGTWTLALAPPWDGRLVALAPEALAASGLRDGTASLEAPGRVRLRWRAP